MRHPWRLRATLYAGVIATTAGTVVAIVWTQERLLASRLEGALAPGQLEQLLDDQRGLALTIGLAGVVLATIVVALAGRLLTRGLAGMRAGTTARNRGAGAHVGDQDIVELRPLAIAIDTLAGDLSGQVRQLTRERDELSRLVSTVSEGIVQVGPDGRIVHANPAARTLLGLPARVHAEPLAAFVRNAELRGVIERAGEGAGSSREIAVDDRRLLVAARPIEPAATAAAPEPGPPTSNRLPVVIAFADLTELRRLEGVRRDFVANVSHELKTPLTSIRGYVETLLGDPELPADMHRQFLEVIHKNAERLQGIIDDLLDLSRLESGGWRPNLVRLDALALARDVWAAFEPRATLQSVEFVLLGDSGQVLADAGGLHQVLTNLYDNALRYTHARGRITARVQPASGANGGTAREFVAIDIIDTGSGIPGDALPRIFERFYRVDPARSRDEGGTGLGLSIVKHLVESMGGDVSAESELGKGTTIRLRLPAA